MRLFSAEIRKEVMGCKIPPQLCINFYPLRGGYMVLSLRNFVWLQRFALKGVDFLGTQREFIFRIELGLDHIVKYSLFTIEVWNPAEARWFHLWVKLWKGLNFIFVFNLGWRLTKSSKDYISKSAMEKLRIVESKKLNNEGGNGKWRHPLVGLKQI